jgi:hypothetical protein
MGKGGLFDKEFATEKEVKKYERVIRGKCPWSLAARGCNSSPAIC